MGPAIHQRQLATAVWLRTGLSDSEPEIPRRYLLAACERVLELKKNVVDQVRTVARSLTPDKAQQLDLLLTQDRSAQLLMDKTLGATNVVNASNIEPLIDEMKKSLADEIHRKAEESTLASKREASRRVRAANDRRRTAEQDFKKIEETLATANAEDKAIVEGLLLEINRKMSSRHFRLKITASLIIAILGCLPLLTDSFSGSTKIGMLVVAGGFASLFAFFQIFDKPIGLSRRVEQWGEQQFQTLAVERGIKSKIERHSFEVRDGKLRIAPLLTMEEL